MYYILLLLIRCNAFLNFNKNKLQPIKINSYNFDGDLSGTYQLSGLWKFYREPIKDYTTKNYKQGWSGNIWNSNTRTLFDSMYIILNSDGSFCVPKRADNSNVFCGKWSCNGDELILTRFHYGYTSYETYVGIYNPKNNGTINGVFCYGANDCEYSGDFYMKQVMSNFNPIIKNNISINYPIFSPDSLIHKWQFTYQIDDSYSSRKIILFKNLTWQTYDYPYNKLSGKWNLYNDSIDLTTGISNYGYNIWLSIERFSKIITDNSNILLEQDRLYIGSIQASSNINISKPRTIDGKICIGWEIEPAFVGNFKMKLEFS